MDDMMDEKTTNKWTAMVHSINDVSELIREERFHQIDKGFCSDHDDNHADNELIWAAVAYALNSFGMVKSENHCLEVNFNISDITKNDEPLIVTLNFWPWAEAYWKPKTRKENLIRAAALLHAEIERMERQESKDEDSTGN